MHMNKLVLPALLGFSSVWKNLLKSTFRCFQYMSFLGVYL